jgi:hypothetical protein
MVGIDGAEMPRTIDAKATQAEAGRTQILHAAPGPTWLTWRALWAKRFKASRSSFSAGGQPSVCRAHSLRAAAALEDDQAPAPTADDGRGRCAHRRSNFVGESALHRR